MALIVSISYLLHIFNSLTECSDILLEIIPYFLNVIIKFLPCFATFLLILVQVFFIFYWILCIFNNFIDNSCSHSKEIYTTEIHSHLTDLTISKKNKFACSECRYNCSSQYDLRYHKRIHTMDFNQQKVFKQRANRYLINNILMLIIILIMFWSLSHHSKTITNKEPKITLPLLLLRFHKRSKPSTYSYYHTRRTILILLLLCGDIDSLKNPGPIPTISDQLGTGISTNGENSETSNTRDCKFCLAIIKKNNKLYTCSNSHIFHPRCYKKVVSNNWCKICAFNELPFADVDIFKEHVSTHRIITNTIVPSQAPNNVFECFKKKGLHFIHLNARSMSNKMSEIKIITRESNPAVLSITESWLDESHTNESISIEGYNFVRRDRITHAGGVIMFVRSDLAFNHRSDLQNDNLEDLWIEILLPKTKPIYVGTCYRAPNNNNLKDCLESTLLKLDSNCDTLILGDFNFCWLKIKNNVNVMKSFTQLMNIFNLNQIIDKATRVTESSETLLDHIYVNNNENICQSGVIELGISDHYMTYCTRKVTRGQIGKHNKVKIRSMKNYCKDLLISKLQSTQWSAVFQSNNINEAWEIFKTIFIQIIDDIAPEKEIRIKVRSEPWMNSEILELIYERDKMLKKANLDKTNKNLRAQYNKLRNIVTKTIKLTKSNYFRNKVEENRYNPKLLWKQFKSIGYRNKIKEKSRIVLDIDNEKCHDSKTITNFMCNFFTNVAKKF